jgi:hypothetical protein
LNDIELYQEAEEDVVGAGKGSGSFILPGLQKLRRICNTSDGQLDDAGLLQEQGKGKGQGEGQGKGEEQGQGQRTREVQGRRIGLVIAKREDRKGCQQQEYKECKSEDLIESKAVKLEHLESEIVFETEETNALILSCADEMEIIELIACDRGGLCSNASTTSTGVLGRAGDHYVQDRSTHNDLEVESRKVVKDEVGVDKNGIAAVQSKRLEKENEEDKTEDADADEGEGRGKSRAVEEGELSMLSNGRIELITPSAYKTHPKPFVALAKFDQKTVITSSASDAPIDPVKTIDPVKKTVLGALMSVPKGPGEGPKGWVVPTKKNSIPSKIVMPSKIFSVLVKKSDSNSNGDDDENERDRIEKEQEKEGKIEVYKSTAQRVHVVKRLHSTVSKHLIAPVPVPVVVTAESLLAGSGKLQVSSTSTSTLPLPLPLPLHLYLYLYLNFFLIFEDSGMAYLPIL